MQPTISDPPPERGAAPPPAGAPPAVACSNCGALLLGPYCAECGQKAAQRVVSLRHILADALEDQLSLNAALPRTLRALFLHPGRLTREYVQGRVATYIPPMRLYLIASVLFFLVLTALPGATSDMRFNRENAAAAGTSTRPAAAAARAPTPTPARPGALVVRIGPASLLMDTVGLAPWIKPAVMRVLAQQRRLARMNPAEARRLLVNRLADDVPKLVFVMVPIFALLLKLLYIRRRRLYVEHFVCALHVHALAFFVFAAALPIRVAPVQLGAYTLVALYVLASMRVVYGQGWVRTTAKFALLSVSYVLLLSVGLIIAMSVAIASV